MPTDELNPAAARLSKLHEQRCQVFLIVSLEEDGILTPETAAIYLVHVLRGGSIYGFPVDGPNAPEAVERWNETTRALQRDSLRLNLQRSSRSPELRVRSRPSRRAPRRRNVRRARAQARSPGSSSDDGPQLPPLRVVWLAAFRRELEKAGL